MGVSSAVRLGRISSGDAAIDAAVAGEYFDHEGVIDEERVAGYRRIEKELAGSHDGVAMAVAYTIDAEDPDLVYLLMGKLKDGQEVLDAPHQTINTDGYGRAEVVMEDTPRITYRTHWEEQGILLLDRGYDFYRTVEVGQFNRQVASEIFTSDRLVEWLEQHVDNRRFSYLVYAEAFELADELGIELGAEGAERPFEEFVTAERRALLDYAEFFREVEESDHRFTNLAADDFTHQLRTAREKFDARSRTLAEQHEGAMERMGDILRDRRSWPYLDAQDYEWILQQSILAQMNHLSREEAEMNTKLERITKRLRVVDRMASAGLVRA